MADLPRSPETTAESQGSTDPDSTVDRPRWVKVFGIIALVLVVLVVVLMLLGGHGPGRHT